MRITLTVTAGPHEGKVFAFAGHDTFLVGRAPVAHFRLPREDRYFSRFHFLVECNPPSCRLQDLGSRNGTYVNGARVERADLRDGDVIRGGRTQLRVVVSHGAALTVTSQDSPTEGMTSSGPSIGLPAIPGYLLLQEIGRGAMGIVYLAVRSADGRRVALKTIRPAASGPRAYVQKFLREAEILGQVNHPNVIAFLDSGEACGLLYFAAEYVAGTDAGAWVKCHGPMDVPSAVGVTGQVLGALASAHARGFVHRDVKPANILLSEREDGRLTAKLADFGLARVYQASQLSGLTLLGDVGGTTAFLPPEQITHFRDAMPATDQYSTAATLYYMLTGRYVFDLPPDLMGCFTVILNEKPVPILSRRPELPDGLASAVHRALAREPDARFADVAAFGAALAPFEA
jgi:serine/threonine-protein kinase